MAMLTNEHRRDAPSRPSTTASTVAKTLTSPFRHPNRLTSLPPLKIPSKPALGKKEERLEREATAIVIFVSGEAWERRHVEVGVQTQACDPNA